MFWYFILSIRPRLGRRSLSRDTQTPVLIWVWYEGMSIGDQSVGLKWSRPVYFPVFPSVLFSCVSLCCSWFPLLLMHLFFSLPWQRWSSGLACCADLNMVHIVTSLHNCIAALYYCFLVLHIICVIAKCILHLQPTVKDISLQPPWTFPQNVEFICKWVYVPYHKMS